ncbi:hypothetical protein SBOR_0128 [Sclerotinia borealis F-4128]|uniref:Aminotransferase class V domain-containing protein n=1 Tax=Sclerotinia borealis (strain F-4128) TaxID=1432307 RepID=W9CXW4_SCLBF|nr:hypothetical protein SBOR_0128 [Sclerotinia borealis F-4128]
MTIRPPFGHHMRDTHFQFSPTYTPLNHGSFGAYPHPIQEAQGAFQEQCTSRPDTFYIYSLPKLIDESRNAVAPLLGADPREVVLVPNATTGVNTVLRNLKWEEGDLIVYFSTIYDACEKTVESVREMVGVQVETHCLVLEFPIGEVEELKRFREFVEGAKNKGLNVKLAIFDTVLTFPGVQMPWEELVRICKELGVLSLIDGAHGIGHIDLTHLGSISPDFFVSNCHKYVTLPLPKYQRPIPTIHRWLYTPRSCAVFYVPLRNQHLIRTSLPTSHGYRKSSANDTLEDINTYFLSMFNFVATIDYTPYLCIPAAISFRNTVCGGEASIRQYCFDLAKVGGSVCASALNTYTLPIDLGRETCFTNIRLPIPFSCSKPNDSQTNNIIDSDSLAFPAADAEKIKAWLNKTAVEEFDTYLQIGWHANVLWVRLSAQIYLELKDFEWAGEKLKGLCERVNAGEVPGTRRGEGLNVPNFGMI